MPCKRVSSRRDLARAPRFSNETRRRSLAVEMIQPAAPTVAPVEAPIFILGKTPMGETDLSEVLDALASELDDEGQPEKAKCFQTLNTILEQRTDYVTVRDITAESVDRNLINHLFKMAGLTPGLAVRFARALDPTQEEGFEWPEPPKAGAELPQRAPGKKSGPKPGTITWSVEPKFRRVELPRDVAVPSLKELGVFDGIPQPRPGQLLADRAGFSVINQRIYNVAQCHPQLQGGGLDLRAMVAWHNELREFCPVDRMPVYKSGLKKGQWRIWDLRGAFSNRRNRTF